MTVTTAGHVDHGKSTLVRALTGQDPDRLAEEQRRGLTIELGFVWCTLPGTSAAPEPLEVAFVDVPGHERFVATALAGVGPASGTVLVVAGDDGWSAQTQEHAEVLHLLGRPVLVTVVSKAAAVSADRLRTVTEDVEARLGALGLDGGPVLAVDAVQGSGLDDLRTRLRSALATLQPPPDHGAPRLWIDRAFTRPGVGTVVTGTLSGGCLQVGDEVRLEPSGTPTRVRGLASLGGPVDLARPGERVACNLAARTLDEVGRGDALVGGPDWRSTGTVDGWLTPLADDPSLARGAWQVHVGTARSAARLVSFPGSPRGAADEGAVRVVLDHRLPLRTGDVVVVREDGRRRTIARVVVADPRPAPLPRGRARREHRAAIVGRLATATSPADRWRGLLELAGGVRRRAELVAATGWSPEPDGVPGVATTGGFAVLETALQAAAHAAAALGPGVHDRGAVLGRLRSVGLRDSAGDAVVDALVRRGDLAVRDAGFVVPAHLGTEVDERATRRQQLLARLREGGLAPPTLDALLAEVQGADGRDVAALVQDRQAVRLGPVLLASSTVADAAATLRDVQGGAPFTAAEARDVLGSTRRIVIPLLEHLARTGVTSFDGSHHRLRRDVTSPGVEHPG